MSNNSPNVHDDMKFQTVAATGGKYFFFALSKKEINNVPFGYINIFEIIVFHKTSLQKKESFLLN